VRGGAGLRAMSRSIAGVELTPHRLKVAGLVVLGAIALWWLYGRIDVAAWHARAERLDGFTVFAALTFLPLFGFPISVLHVIAGARFGVALGLALVGISIVIQLLLSYWFVALAPGFFARRMAPWRARLPRAAHRPLTQFTMLVPGAPYFVQNYVLPVMGVPLGTYVLWGTLLHFVRSMVGVAFGEVSGDLTPLRIALFCLYGVTITLACAWAFRRLRAQLRHPQSAGDGPMPLS
jgi:uncharacterized membrane protein YdjX (TVP38/TMEM64 family)